MGRERELAELFGAFDAARAGKGGFALIAGEPGIGKTALASALAERAESEGGRVVWGRCWEGGGAPAYWPWGRIVDELCRDRDVAQLERELGPGAYRLARIAPELGERLQGRPPDPVVESDGARFAMLNSLVAFLRVAGAAQPLVIVLDDVHAADPDALQALEFVAGELHKAQVLGVATYQDPATRPRPGSQELIDQLAHDCRRVQLKGLPQDDLARMLERQMGATPRPDLVDQLFVQTDGHPLFAAEIVRTLLAERRLGGEQPVGQLPLPSGVRHAVQRRLKALPEAVRTALGVAAACGRDFRLAILERATGIDRAELVGALDAAVRAGLIVPGDDAGQVSAFHFTHGLVREAIYAGLPATDRIRLHGAVADAMEDIDRGVLDSRLAELAHHFALAAALGGNAPKAVDFATRAGRAALDALAWKEAARLFEQALTTEELGEPDPIRQAELLADLGRAQTHAGTADARATLQRAGDAARAAQRPDLVARAALEFGAFALSPGLDQELVDMLERALDALEPGDSALRARLLARLAVALYYAPDVERRRELSDEAVAIAERVGDEATLVYTKLNRQHALWSPDRTEELLRSTEELMPLADAIGDLEAVFAARIRRTAFLLELDDIAGLDRAIAELERAGARSRDPRLLLYVPLERSRRVALEGRFDEAMQLTGQAIQLSANMVDSTVPMQARGQVLGMFWIQGKLAELIDALRQAVVDFPAMPAYRAGLALALGEAGREAEARSELGVVAARDFAGIPRDNLWLLAMALSSEACARLGDAERARVAYELLAPFADRNAVGPNSIYAGPVPRYLGLLAATAGDLDAAEEHFATAWERAKRVGARALVMRTRIDHAQMLLGRAGPDDLGRAQEMLDDAAALAEELRTDAIQARIEAIRDRVGAPAAAPAAAIGPFAATLRREGEVWRFDYEGRVVHVRDSKGMRYLATLLSSPGIEMHSLDLDRGDEETAAVTGAEAAQAGLGVRPSGDEPLVALDASAKRAYKERLKELRDDLEQAEAWNDAERATRARAEMDLIASELAGAVGLAGQDRPIASGSERARVRVTRAIHTALKRIASQDEPLGLELKATIRTGTFNSFVPDQRRPVNWTVEAQAETVRAHPQS